MGLSDLITNINQDSIKGQMAKELFDTEENLETKTELAKPMIWSVLSLFEDYTKNKNLPKSSAVLNAFTLLSFKYLISKGRKGREEYVKIVQSLNEISDEEENKPQINRITG